MKQYEHFQGEGPKEKNLHSCYFPIITSKISIPIKSWHYDIFMYFALFLLLLLYTSFHFLWVYFSFLQFLSSFTSHVFILLSFFLFCFLPQNSFSSLIVPFFEFHYIQSYMYADIHTLIYIDVNYNSEFIYGRKNSEFGFLSLHYFSGHNSFNFCSSFSEKYYDLL